jgi:hypothetical protein
MWKVVALTSNPPLPGGANALVHLDTETLLCPRVGGHSVRAWADCQQFGLVELKGQESLPAESAVSVISQDCDDVFWHFTKYFPSHSQIQTPAAVTNRHVSKPIDT